MILILFATSFIDVKIVVFSAAPYNSMSCLPLLPFWRKHHANGQISFKPVRFLLFLLVCPKVRLETLWYPTWLLLRTLDNGQSVASACAMGFQSYPQCVSHKISIGTSDSREMHVGMDILRFLFMLQESWNFAKGTHWKNIFWLFLLQCCHLFVHWY